MNSNLHQQLESLQQQLQSSSSLDPEARAQLTRLMADIHRVLQRSDADEHASVLDRLDSAAVRFESEHPSLGTGLRQLIDTLGKAGI